MDRFLMRIRIGYPGREAEREILRASSDIRSEKVRPVISGDALVQLQEDVARIPVDDALMDYMLAIVERTRQHESLAMGVSPRGAQALYRASQGLAAVEGRDFVTPDDVKRMTVPVFAHRVMVNTRSAMGKSSGQAAEKILEEILKLVEVPL